LSSVPGCDGLKTGYYSEAGYSIAATAQRGGRRIIVVVLGSPSGGGRQPWDLRDTVTTQLIERGFAALPPAIPQIASAPAGSPAPTAAKPTGAAAVPATAPAVASAATTAAPPAVAPAQSDDTSALKLIPLAPGEKPETPGGDASTEPTVHVTVSGGKR
jgi:D-alanyl-D-alanine carboxypeptidase (penicillin-binding protein 5/6)